MVATEQAKVDCLTQLTTALTGFLVPTAATVPAPEVQAQAARSGQTIWSSNPSTMASRTW